MKCAIELVEVRNKIIKVLGEHTTLLNIIAKVQHGFSARTTYSYESCVHCRSK